MSRSEFRLQLERTVLRPIGAIVRRLGLHPEQRHRLRRYRQERLAYDDSVAKTGRVEFPTGTDHPYLFDWDAEAGTASGHYFHQDLWVAQQIHDHSPEQHYDVGSRLDGFVAHVAAFRPLSVLDVRPVSPKVSNVAFVQRDITVADPSFDGITDSLSCLHTLEHIGLGRYGDRIDADGWRSAFANLTKMVRFGGRLYLSVPIGPQRVEFNGQRVFAVPTIIDLVSGDFDIASFAMINDAGELEIDVSLDSDATSESFGQQLGCGIFTLTRRTSQSTG